MNSIASYQDYVEELQRSEWLLVYFTASWCGPCASFAPIMEKVSDGFNKILSTVKVDTGSVPEIAGLYELRSVPTLLLIHKGKVIEGTVGVQSYMQVSSWLSRHILII